MAENSENLDMSFLYPIDWDISFPEEFDNFHANQDKLEENGSGGSGTCRHFQFWGFFSPNILLLSEYEGRGLKRLDQEDLC